MRFEVDFESQISTGEKVFVSASAEVIGEENGPAHAEGVELEVSDWAGEIKVSPTDHKKLELEALESLFEKAEQAGAA